MATKCNNSMGLHGYMIPSQGCQYKSKELYQLSQGRSGKGVSCQNPSKYSLNLRNAPTDDKKDWIEGQVIRVHMGLGKPSTDQYYYFEIISAKTKSEGYHHDGCSASGWWDSSYKTCEDALSGKNCLANIRSSGFVDYCEKCIDEVEAPCPKNLNVQQVPLPPPENPDPPVPPVQPPIDPPNTVRCIYEWEVKWDCIKNKLIGWRYVGKACNHNGPYFEWICTGQSTLATGWVCTLKYYVLGPKETAMVGQTCNNCLDRTRWAVQNGGTGQRAILIGATWNTIWSQVQMDQWIPKSEQIYFPKDWPSPSSIRKRKGNTPCLCQKYYSAAPCVDCNNVSVKVAAHRKWPLLLQSPFDFMRGLSSRVVVYNDKCVTMTVATEAQIKARTPVSMAHRFITSWNTADPQPNCHDCMNGVLVAKIRCDLETLTTPAFHPKLDKKLGVNWALVTAIEAEHLIEEGWLEYLIIDISKNNNSTVAGAAWEKFAKTAFPVVYVDDDNICWHISSALQCPTAWVRSQAIARIKDPGTGKLIPLIGRHGEKMKNYFPEEIKNKLDPTKLNSFNAWRGNDATCEKCQTESTCPRLVDYGNYGYDWRGPETVSLTYKDICINFKQPNCKCVSQNHPNRGFNSYVGFAGKGNDFIKTFGRASKATEAWAFCPKAHGGMANDKVYFYWLYRNRGRGEGQKDWKQLSGSYLTNKNVGKCLSPAAAYQVTIQRSGKSVMRPLRSVAGFPKKVNEWTNCMVVNFLTPDDDLEFHPFPFTCPCEKWKAGTPRSAAGAITFPKPGNCDCAKIHDAHPIEVARGHGGKKSYCSDSNLTGHNGKQRASIEVTYTAKPKHHGVSMGDKVAYMWFDAAGGDCPNAGNIRTWTNSHHAKTWGKKWCANCKEKEWKLLNPATGNPNPGWYETGYSVNGRIGRWFCGDGFGRDQANQKGTTSAGATVPLNVAPYNVGFNGTNIVSKRCCYKLTNIDKPTQTYKVAIYNSIMWGVPMFNPAHHVEHWMRGKGEAMGTWRGGSFYETQPASADMDACENRC